MIAIARLMGMAAVGVLFVSGTASADRAPSPEEREQIEAQLTELGFSSWEEIEFDDGYWEVDDAIAEDGTEYDLKLDPDTLEVVERERD